jgi:hypothetical protein
VGSRQAGGFCRPPLGRAAVVLAAAILLAGCSEAPARCRDELAAAFERLRTSGRPYRKEMTVTVDGHQTFQQTTEYLPPDHMHEVTNNRIAEVEANGVRLPAHEIASEVIRIGPRAWSKEMTEWREWEPGLAQEIYGAGMDFLLLPDRILPANTAFECLGGVAFKDNVYVRYRAKLDKAMSYTAPKSPKEREKLEAKVRQELQQMQEWRTVFVDESSGLPVYDIVAAENQLDRPRYQVHYTYPADMKIEPPVP